MSPAAAVARDVRRSRSKARRERQSLGDALYVIYVTVLVSLYPLAALGARSAPRPGILRSTAAGLEPLLVLGIAVAVVIGRAAAAVRGGPVILPPEDARLLLTWPIPRRALVLPALGAALTRTLAGSLLASVILVYVDVRDLGAPAVAVLRDDLLLPALLSAVTVLVAWLVQVSPALAGPARAAGALLGVAALITVCWTARRIVQDGVPGALVDLARLGPATGSLPFSGAAGRAPSSHGPIVAVVLVLVLIPLGLLSVRAAGRVTPEQLLSRSRRADVTRTGLKLGFTSSVYLTRTEPMRRARRRRRALPIGSNPTRALLGKAVVQEQGTPLLPRLLACAVVSGAALSAAARITPGRGLAPTIVWSGLAGLTLTVVATRFADPIRLDVDRAPIAGGIPLPHLQLTRVDIGTSAAVAFAGTAVGVLGAVALGLVGPSRLPELMLAGGALSVLLAAGGALGALSDDPSPFLPPALAIGYRTTGVLAVMTGCVLSALLMRHQGATTTPGPHDRLPAGLLVLVAAALVAGALATLRGASAITRGR